MMTPACDAVRDDLAALVDGDEAAMARHGEHLAGCDDCRDARHEAARTAEAAMTAGGGHVPPGDLVERLLARIDAEAAPVTPPPVGVAVKMKTSAKMKAKESSPSPSPSPSPLPLRRASGRRWLVGAAAGAAALAAASIAGVYLHTGAPPAEAPVPVATGEIGKIDRVESAGKSATGLVAGAAIAPGATLATDERTRLSLTLADGTHLTLDHGTTVTFDAAEPRHVQLAAGKLVADVAHVDGHPAAFATPSGTVDVVGTRFELTATATTTSVQVVRGAVVLRTPRGARDEVRAGEEGTIDHGTLAVAAAPEVAREVAWAELGDPTKAAATDEVTSGLGSLRAYKAGETRDRDWNLALAQHAVKVRIVGPIARTEITETFRNDANATLEGVFQFPLPADAQIESLALDVPGSQPIAFNEGAFVDKARAKKIWNGVIQHAAPRLEKPTTEIIWVPGRWRDPALLDWQRGGRFELRVFPIPSKGARTIKLAYTQVVTPRGPGREYTYPLAHSRDGSTVADNFTFDVEVRGAAPGSIRSAGYDLVSDPARTDAGALSFHQGGFVPRGDLAIDYRPADGAELRAWTFAGGTAAGPDEALAAKHGVGIEPTVVAAQRAEAKDLRPTAVLALHPLLPRWRAEHARDFAIVVDRSQSMTGERETRAADLVAQMVAQMDRRDRVTLVACDSACRRQGEPRTPSATTTADARAFLAAEPAAGASDLVAAIRDAAASLPDAPDREKWILYIGDGFATTGFRRASDVERALASTTRGARVSTIGIGGDADSALLGAAARAGGGSYVAWLPGETVASAALAALGSTDGSALRDATIELPAGLADVTPARLPTLRAGEETLLAARMTGAVDGDVIIRGTLGGQAYEQRYPLHLAVSSAPGNAFVPRLWASLAIDELERGGAGADRARIVALSQGYGVMSRETSLLVLESQAMFDAFGVDRHGPAQTWTGEEALDEASAIGAVAQGGKGAPSADLAGAVGDVDGGLVGHGAGTGHGYGLDATRTGSSSDKKTRPADNKVPVVVTAVPATPAPMPTAVARPSSPAHAHLSDVAAKQARAASEQPVDRFEDGRGRRMVPMIRTWVRVPSVTAYDGVNPAIATAVTTFDADLTARPDSREAHRALVQALSYAGELDRARDVAARWLDRDRLDPQALGYEADLLGRAGQRELALRTLAGLVDLDADRVALHERMVQAYEAVGRRAQACGHRIALATLQPKDLGAAGRAAVCLRRLGRANDAELVLAALPDNAARAAAEKAGMVTPLAAAATGELVADAHWSGGADLDISLVTPDGTRVSWMGGRDGTIVTDATATDREKLALRTLKRGNYLIEVSRIAGTSSAPVRGTLDITALGERRALPFELTGDRVVVGRISIALEAHLEPAW